MKNVLIQYEVDHVLTEDFATVVKEETKKVVLNKAQSTI